MDQRENVRGPKPAGPEFPKLPNGEIDKDRVHQEFLASKHVEWKPFCDGQGWPTVQSYHHFPVKQWSDEKKRILATAQAEEISNQLFGYKSNWHKRVLNAQKLCPDAASTTMALVMRRQKSWAEMIQRDDQALKLYHEMRQKMPNAVHEVPISEYETKVDMSDVARMTVATGHAIRALQESLMLHRWSVEQAESFSTPQGALEASDAQSAREDKEWKLELIGGENITKKEMEAFMHRFLDAPQRTIEMSPTPAPAKTVTSDIPEQPVPHATD